MIPVSYIIEWRVKAPWNFDSQVEQDLLISRILCEIFSDDYLFEKLAFRVGTALNKLFFKNQFRYSEDIDLVQVNPEQIGEVLSRIRKKLSFLGNAEYKVSEGNNSLIYKYISEIEPKSKMKIKIEINCREHFTVFNLIEKNFNLESEYYKGNCKIKTYNLEELIGTKLRALYQRKKGRDLFDIYKALTLFQLNTNNIIKAYKEYMLKTIGKFPTQTQYLENLKLKILDNEFKGDLTALLILSERYNHDDAFRLIKNELISLM